MTTPLPDRCSPSVWAVNASSGIDDWIVTMDLRARSRLELNSRDLCNPCCSERRGFSVIGLSLRLPGSMKILVRKFASHKFPRSRAAPVWTGYERRRTAIHGGRAPDRATLRAKRSPRFIDMQARVSETRGRGGKERLNRR